jgi:hypothetical protein
MFQYVIVIHEGTLDEIEEWLAAKVIDVGFVVST